MARVPLGPRVNFAPRGPNERAARLTQVQGHTRCDPDSSPEAEAHPYSSGAHTFLPYVHSVSAVASFHRTIAPSSTSPTFRGTHDGLDPRLRASPSLPKVVRSSLIRRVRSPSRRRPRAGLPSVRHFPALLLIWPPKPATRRSHSALRSPSKSRGGCPFTPSAHSSRLFRALREFRMHSIFLSKCFSFFL